MNPHRDIPAMAREATGSGPPLVLLPGGLTGWLSWIPHAEALADSRRVTRLQLHSVALGLAGEPLPDDYSVGYEVAAMHRALDEMGLEQADFAGWSYGGCVALSAALDDPARVRTLTLIEPAAFWVLRDQEQYAATLAAEQAFAEKMGGEWVTEEQLDGFLHWSGLLPDEVDARTLPQWPLWVEHRHSLRLADAPMRHDEDPARLRTFERPVLLIKGEGSAPMMHEIIDALAAELPDARVVTLPGAHAAHIVAMDEFMTHFERLLADGRPA